MVVTEGHLLGGRVRYAQMRDGFRSGIEPVLLAAAIPARAGDHVLEGGTGAGATLLCLTARVPGIRATGVEQDADLTRLASDNASANSFDAMRFVCGDVLTVDVAGPVDHACANPPYHDPASPPSPYGQREQAKRASLGWLAMWADALGRRLRPGGTLTFILPATLLPACLTALQAAGCPASRMLPLWPKAGRACKLLLLRGIKDGRTPFGLLPGLTLHGPDGGFTPEAEAILRGGASLDIV
jgi:tRNA1(Val) A37 N6-methylase TrmN6